MHIQPIARDYDSLSIIVPAYNEEGGLADTLEQLLALRQDWPLNHVEIILIDDGSTDSTATIAQRYTRDIELVSHPANRGYGASLKTGIRHASHDLICITDADGTYPNDRIYDLIEKMKQDEADMVVGARTGKNVNIPLIRRPAKWFIRRLAIYVVQQDIPDLNSGLRLFHRPIAQAFFRLLPNQFSFTTTITLAMIANAYVVSFMPIDYYARIGRSKIRPIHDTLNFIQLVLKIALYFAPLRVFLPVSIFLIVSGFAWGVYSTTAVGRFADTSTLIVMMTGVQIGAIGLLAELINQRS